jgi:hypothetical protein
VAAYQGGLMSIQYYLAMMRKAGASTNLPASPDGLVDFLKMFLRTQHSPEWTPGT